MIAEKETLPVPIAPVIVTVVGNGTGNGSPIPSGTELITPDHQPNVIYNVIKPIIAIAVRFGNVYLGVLVGTLLGALGTGVIPASDFLHLLMKCASLSLCGPFVLMLKDIGTVFMGLEKKFPLLTGSV